MVSLLLSSSSEIIRLFFESIPELTPQRPGKALWIVQDIHPLFSSSGFVTSDATPVLSIFTSFYRHAFSISVGSKCAIMHSLLLHCFNVNILHLRSCTFSPSKHLHFSVSKFYPCQLAQDDDMQFCKYLVIFLHCVCYRRVHICVCFPCITFWVLCPKYFHFLFTLGHVLSYARFPWL